MNLPWYGCSRCTCFVRSRSGSSASDQERSRSSVAYSSSCVTATRRDSTRRLERLRNSLHAAVAHRDHVEPDGEPPELGTCAEPGLRRATQPPPLLRRHHLERVAEPRALLLLDLDEAKIAAAPDDQVELVAADPDVLAEDLPAPQPVPPHRSSFGGEARAGPRHWLEASSAKPTAPGRRIPGRLWRPVVPRLRSR